MEPHSAGIAFKRKEQQACDSFWWSNWSKSSRLHPFFSQPSNMHKDSSAIAHPRAGRKLAQADTSKRKPSQEGLRNIYLYSMDLTMDLYPKRLQHMTFYDLGCLSWVFCRCFPCLSFHTLWRPRNIRVTRTRRTTRTLGSWNIGFSFGSVRGQYVDFPIFQWTILGKRHGLWLAIELLLTTFPADCRIFYRLSQIDFFADFWATWPAWTNEEFASGCFVLERSGARRGRYSSRWPWQLDQLSRDIRKVYGQNDKWQLNMFLRW